MKGLLRLLVRLYPPLWRQRYESEFGALLEDVHSSWHTVADVIKGGVTMRLKMWADWKIVAVTTLLGMIGGLLVAYEIRDEYVSSAMINVHSAVPANGDVGVLLRKVLTDEALAKIIEQNNLYPDLRSREQMAAAIAEIKKGIKIQPAKLARADQSQSGMVVQFTYYDRPLSQRICSQLIDRIMWAASEYGGGLGSKPTLALSMAPDLPNGPVYPNRLNLLISGFVCGFMAGLAVALVRRRRASLET